MNRHLPDSRQFRARIAPLASLNKAKMAFAASKWRSKPAVDGTATLKRARFACTEAYLSP
jgi:hypothetical protein